MFLWGVFNKLSAVCSYLSGIIQTVHSLSISRTQTLFSECYAFLYIHVFSARRLWNVSRPLHCRNVWARTVKCMVITLSHTFHNSNTYRIIEMYHWRDFRPAFKNISVIVILVCFIPLLLLCHLTFCSTLADFTCSHNNGQSQQYNALYHRA